MQNKKKKKNQICSQLWLTVAILMLSSQTIGCTYEDGDLDGDFSTDVGSLNVLLEAEDTITDGLQAGSEVENIEDGWSVTFAKYIAVVGGIDVHLATDEQVEAEASEFFAVDLTTVPENGLPLWTLPGLQAGDWAFNYALGGAAGEGVERHQSVSEEDFALMQTGDLTYLIEGTMTKEGGESCAPAADPCQANATIGFRFAEQAKTVFGPCEFDGQAGFTMPEGSSQNVGATLHGDHVFFNGFPEGDEGGVTRLAQWVADSDTNVDGTVTAEELEALTPADMPAMADYELGGAPITIDTLHDYVVAQLKTQGHYQGEGACAVDGVAHSHDGHDHGDDDHGDDDHHDEHDH